MGLITRNNQRYQQLQLIIRGKTEGNKTNILVEESGIK